MSEKPIAVGADHAGCALRRILQGWNVAFEELGTHDESSVNYPDFAHRGRT
jgi:ribose 5-phosphate isomerase RpiB